MEKRLDSVRQAQIDCVSAKNQAHLHKYPNKASKNKASKCFKVEQQAVYAVCAVCAPAHLGFEPSESPRLTHQTALAAPKKINK